MGEFRAVLARPLRWVQSAAPGKRSSDKVPGTQPRGPSGPGVTHRVSSSRSNCFPGVPDHQIRDVM